MQLPRPVKGYRRIAVIAVLAAASGGILATANSTIASADVINGSSVDALTVPAIAAFNGSLAACWVSNGVLNVTSPGAGRTGPTGIAANGGCSMAGFGGQEYVAWTDPSSGAVDYDTVDQTTGGVIDPISLFGAFSNFAPALASWNNNLYIAWTGTNGKLNVRDITTSFQKSFEASSAAPALNGGPGYLEIAWLGSTNTHLNVAALSSGLSENCKETFANETSALSPGLTTLNGRPYLSWTGQDSLGHINLIADSSASNGCAFPNSSGKIGDAYESVSAPGLSQFNGAVWIIWGGIDKNSTLNITKS